MNTCQAISAFLAGGLLISILIIAAGWSKPKTEIHADKIKQKGEGNNQDTIMTLPKKKKGFLGIGTGKNKRRKAQL